MDLRGAITTEAVQQAIGKAVKEYRISRKLTQQDLADRSGVSLRSISRTERGEDISLELFIKIMRALGLQENLGLLIPDISRSPSYYLEKTPKRVRKSSEKEVNEIPFRWGDEL